jgi:hypothetical protein
MRLAETQTDMRGLINRMSEQGSSASGMDETTRTHIRNLDLRLEHLLNDVASGRDYAVQEIRGEIRLLTRTIAAMAEEAE